MLHWFEDIIDHITNALTDEKYMERIDNDTFYGRKSNRGRVTKHVDRSPETIRKKIAKEIEKILINNQNSYEK